MRTRVILNGVGVALLCGLLAHDLSFAQGEAQDQEVGYTHEEYSAYEAAIGEADPAKREAAIMAFMKENPNSALVEYALGNYLQLLETYHQNGQWQQLVGASEKLLDLRSDHLAPLYFAMLGSFQLQDFAKAAKFGEKVYEQNQDHPVPFILAMSYRGLNEIDQYAAFGEKALPNVDPVFQAQILTELRTHFATQRNWGKSADYARKTLEVLNDGAVPEGREQAEWQDYVGREKAISYAVLGRQAFERDNFSVALTNYNNALRTYSRSATLNAEAHYYIGMCHWKQARIDPAMEAFARAANQRGADPNIVKVSQQYLERLYRSTHNDSLAGLDEFVQRVTGGRR